MLLDGSASTDPDQAFDTLTYEWDLDGDNEPNLWDIDDDGDGVYDGLDLNPEHVDLDHESGLSSEGFDFMNDQFMLDDLDFALEPE